MKDVVVIGAGKIGSMIADLLANSGSYRVIVADCSRKQLDRLETAATISMEVVDVQNSADLVRLLTGKFAVLSAVPHNLTAQIGEASKAAGAHYLDLTEDVAATRRVKSLAAGAGTAFIPQCGLAPGFISIVAHDLVKRYETLDTVRMRVGALPRYPFECIELQSDLEH